MLDEQSLKARLLEIAAQDYEPPTRPELYPLVLAMGTYTGVTDPELRDDLIYTTMATWIARDIFEPKDLNEILAVVLNEQHLFWGLGEQDTDSVFARSFSMLIIAAILEAHRRQPFLAYPELEVIKRKVLRYLAGERDFRGYVPAKGWAHAIAHAADTINELAQCPELEESDLLEILQALQPIIANPVVVYCCEEDERLVTAVLSICRREELGVQEIILWLHSLTADDVALPQLPERYYRFVNCKNFIRSLYFRTALKPLPASVQETIERSLDHFNRFQSSEGLREIYAP